MADQEDLLSPTNHTFSRANSVDMATLAVNNIADHHLAFIPIGETGQAPLFVAGVVPATRFNDLIGAP